MTKLAVFLSLTLLPLIGAEEDEVAVVSHGMGLLPPKENLPVDEKSKKYFERIMKRRSSAPQFYSSVERGLVSPVRNQHNCGSCVAFATLAILETCYKKVSGVFGDYSEQELLDCAYGKHEANGCAGASSFSYARWIDENKRQLTHEFNYPYKDELSSCPTNLEPYNLGARMTDHYYDSDGNEKEMKKLVFLHGAVITSLYANSTDFLDYKSGIFDGCESDHPQVNHAVAVVGYGTEGGVDYWLIKNSWGTHWGEKGFMKLKRGEKMCGIGKEIVAITCEKDETPTNAPPEKPCTDNYSDCHDFTQVCYQEDVSTNCMESCGLCEGMTPHPSNTCYDLSGGDYCQTYTESMCYHDEVSANCKKSCGLCEGMTPHPSNTCYDISSNCQTYMESMCYHEEVSAYCKKSCGLCEGMTPHPSNTCYDLWGGDYCKSIPKDYCQNDQISKGCEKSCDHCF